MSLEKIYKEEDLFPREITIWEEREYGVLFYNEDNKDSYGLMTFLHTILFLAGMYIFHSFLAIMETI